jgi:hypothetical protein
MNVKMKKSPKLNKLVEENWQSLFCSGEWCCVYNGKGSIGTINASTKEELFKDINLEMSKEKVRIRGIYHQKQPIDFEVSEPNLPQLLSIK